MPRINGIGWQVSGGNAGLWINPVDEAGYPRINTLPRWQLSTHKRYSQGGVFTHKQYRVHGSKLGRARLGGIPLYVSFPVCKRFTCMSLRLSVEILKGRIPTSGLATHRKPCISNSKSKPSGLASMGRNAKAARQGSAINCSEGGKG